MRVGLGFCRVCFRVYVVLVGGLWMLGLALNCFLREGLFWGWFRVCFSAGLGFTWGWLWVFIQGRFRVYLGLA